MKRILLTVTLLAAFALQGVGVFKRGDGGRYALTVDRSAIALDIVDHEPVNTWEKNFDIYAEKLYCFTSIRGGEPGDRVEHVWRWGDKIMARVPLTTSR